MLQHRAPQPRSVLGLGVSFLLCFLPLFSLCCAVLRYASCSSISPWSLLPSSLVHTLKRSDQLTIHARGSGGGAALAAESTSGGPATAREAVRAAEKGRAAAAAAAAAAAKAEKTKAKAKGMKTLANPSAATAAAIDAPVAGVVMSTQSAGAGAGAGASAGGSAANGATPTSAPSTASVVPPSPTSYYSQLLSSLSWLFSDSADQANHRFARLYIQEQQERALEKLDALLDPRAAASTNATRPAPTMQSDADAGTEPGVFLSPCCHRQYRRVLTTYFTALRFIRPNFDEARSIKRRGGRRGRN